MPCCDLASGLSQSVGGWPPRAATFCRIWILENPSFPHKALGAGLKSHLRTSSMEHLMQDSQRNLVGGRRCALRFWETAGQLELSGRTRVIHVPPLRRAAGCRPPARVRWGCWGGCRSSPTLARGPVQLSSPAKEESCPRNSVADLLSVGTNLFSGCCSVQKVFLTYAGHFIFPYIFAMLIVVFSQHVRPMPSQYLCRNESRSSART